MKRPWFEQLSGLLAQTHQHVCCAQRRLLAPSNTQSELPFTVANRESRSKPIACFSEISEDLQNECVGAASSSSYGACAAALCNCAVFKRVGAQSALSLSHPFQ